MLPDVEKLDLAISPNVTFTPSSDIIETLKTPSLQGVVNHNVDLSVNGTMSPSNVSLVQEDTTSAHDHSENTQEECTFKAYLTVFGSFLALFCTFGHMNSFGTYQAWYSENQLHHLAPSTISWIGSLQLWVFFFSGGPTGQIFDKFGPTWIMFAGTLIYVFAIMMTSLSTRFYQFVLSQGILFGLGVGLLFYPSLASVSTFFTKYRATALGIAAAGSSVGGVIYPIMLQRLFTTVGFGWGVRISGLVSALCCIIATLSVTSLSSSSSSSSKRSTLCVNWRTFSDTRYVLLTFGSCLVALGLFIPLFYIVKYAEHLSIPHQQTFYVLAVMNAGGIFGRIAPAYLSDTLGRFNLLVPSAFFSGLSCLLLWIFTKNLTQVMVFAAIYGFFSGAFISVITPCVAQISDMRQIGIRIGMLYSVISFPSLIGGPVAGALLARTTTTTHESSGSGSFNGMIIFAGSTVVAGSFFILLSRLSINPRILARV